MKNLIIVLFMFCTATVFGQSEAEEMFTGSTRFASIENYLYEYEEASQEYIKVGPFQWSEFDYNIDTQHAIPDKVFISTLFWIPPIDAGEELLEGTIFFKTTIQFVYGADVRGANIANPFTGEEIPILAGSFISRDIIEMYERGTTILRFKSDDFLLKEYLLKNDVSFISENEDTYKYLGRIILKTYVGSSKDKLNTVVETVINPMGFYTF